MSASKELYRQRIMRHPYSSLLYFFFLFFLFPGQSIAQKNSTSPPPFTARLINLEAAANTTFTYNARLTNDARVPRIYQLSANVPSGWNVAFKTEGYQVTSINIDSGKTQDITVEIIPGIATKPGKYNIPVTAVTGPESFKLDLEAVVKGTYGVSLTTPTGRLSDDVTEGNRKEIHLRVRNTGTITLDNLDLSAQAPPQWEATFSPASIKQLEPNKETEIIATLKVPDKTIAGDYVTTFSVKTPQSTSDAAFRMTVKTSALTGWLGILIILAALGAVYYLIRKYGRR